MHALIANGAVEKYPYTIGNLRKDNPNTSFPKRPTDELLAEWGMQPVARSDRPAADHTKNVTEGTPKLVDGVWTQVWITSAASPAEIAERVEAQAQIVREERASLLADTDWIVIYHTEKGTNIPMAWEAYRQALRDITDQPGFPFEVTWPSKPE